MQVGTKKKEREAKQKKTKAKLVYKKQFDPQLKGT